MSQGHAFLAQSSDVRLLANPLRSLPALNSPAICEVRSVALVFKFYPKPDYWVFVWIHRGWFTKFVCNEHAEAGAGADASRSRTNPADETMGRAEELMGDQRPPLYKVSLDLRLLLECLEVFGGSSGSLMTADEKDKKVSTSRHPDVFNDRKTTSLTAFELSLPQDPESMSLMLEENEVVAKCSLNLFTVEDEPEDRFTTANTKLARMITDADWLSAVLQSIHPSCERVRISFTPQKRNANGTVPGKFRLEADTDMGSVGAELLSTANNVFNYNCCDTGAGPYSYSFAAFANLIRTLGSASKISLSLDSRAVFGVHCLVPVSMTVWRVWKEDKNPVLPSVVYTIAALEEPDT